MYNKVNVKRHFEIRKCLNCGKEWKVVVKKDAISTKKAHFCAECSKKLSNWEKKKLRYKNDPDYYEYCKKQKSDSHKRHIVHYLWFRAKQRAEKHGYDFDIDEEDIIIPEKCPLLEVPLILGDKGNYEYTPSLDRIDNSKGYIKGNIQVISSKANTMKNSATPEELIKFCKNILRYSPNYSKEIEQKNKKSFG